MLTVDYILQYLSAAVLGDIIGYRDGIWEFNGRTNESYRQLGPEYTNEIVFQFLALGGVNDIDIRLWNYSDDSIMLIDTVEVIIGAFDSLNDFGDKLAKSFVTNLHAIEKYDGGRRTIQSLTAIKNGTRWKDLPYDPTAKGSGTAMRTSIIGVLYSGKDYRMTLVALTIIACKITHFSVVGIMSGLQVALFSAYAVENIPYCQWNEQFLKDIQSDEIYKYIKGIFKGKVWEIEFEEYLGKMGKYQQWRFSHTRGPEGINYLASKMMINPATRIKILADKFTDSKPGNFYPGGRGDEAVLLAYDAFIESQGSWEKLIVNGMLHSGDSDTVGSISAGWFALVYPGKIPKYDNPRLDMEPLRSGLKKYIKKM
jgi:ADP-ribosylglycohydrolase